MISCGIPFERYPDTYKDAGKKLDMVKSCLRFKQLDDLPLEAIGRIIAAVPADEFIAVRSEPEALTAPGAGRLPLGDYY